MDEKNTIMKGFGEFLLGLVKMCVTIALMIGTVVVSAFFVVQGTFVVLNKYGFRGITIELVIMFVALACVCFAFEEKREEKRERNKVQRTRTEAAPEKPEPRWRRNAPTTLTNVPLEEWSIGALTILRQIELAFDSKHVYESTTCEPILRALEPTRRGSYLFVDDNDPVVLREFIRNGGVAKEYKTVNFSSMDPSEIKLAGYKVGFYVAKTDDTLSDLARSIRSEAQAEIDRRALENKKEAHRD